MATVLGIVGVCGALLDAGLWGVFLSKIHPDPHLRSAHPSTSLTIMNSMNPFIACSTCRVTMVEGGGDAAGWSIFFLLA